MLVHDSGKLRAFVQAAESRNKGKMASKPKSDQLDRQIDENLRRVYTDAAKEPVPDRFAKLLEQLRESEAETKSRKGTS